MSVANLLQTPTLFKDGANTSPPAQWNGTAYVFSVPDTLTFIGTAAAGDTLSGAISSTSSGDYDAGHHVAVLVNGTDALVWDYPTQSYPTSFNVTLSAGDTVQIIAKNDGCGYSPQFRLTPPPVPVVFVPGTLVRQQTTHRINRGIDSPVSCYVRNEAGKVDLSMASVIEAKLYDYGKGRPIVTIEATGDVSGLVSFTVPADAFRSISFGYDYGYSADPRNLMRFDVFADGVLVYQALMEIV